MNAEKLNKWSELLLDTGKRNNLIHFKDTKMGTLEILFPDFVALFNRAEHSATFEVYDPKLEDEEEFAFTKESLEESLGEKYPSKDDYLNAYKNKLKKQQILVYNAVNKPISALKNISKKAKSAVEETGVNIAYIAFGFIHWTENENAQQVMRAPILLVPVTIENESVIDPYYVKVTDDEIIVNPTFAFKLQNEYGIKLPEFDDDEGIEAYFEKIKELVAKLKWTVSTECKMGIFSFLKINMYRDLKDNGEKIVKNKSVRALLGEMDAKCDAQGGEGVHGMDLLDLHNVVDADSSSADEKEEEKPSFSSESSKDGITFADVAGLDDVKEQIIFHVLEPMRNPELAKEFGIKPGGKILLYGPPGTGKTFIARAIAGEVNAAFYAVNCQDLISKYMGDSSKQLEKLFTEAQKNEKAIIFFDEFDSVASKRGDGTGGVDAEMARFVATFLTKVDGFKPADKNKMLLLIAATNRPWALDSAMLRGGRFDTQIYVGVPDQKAREWMVNKAMAKLPLDADVDLQKLAMALEGFGGGDIVAVCDKIRLEAYKRSVILKTKQNITREDCNKILSGIRNHITAEEMAKFIAYKNGAHIE